MLSDIVITVSDVHEALNQKTKVPVLHVCKYLQGKGQAPVHDF